MRKKPQNDCWTRNFANGLEKVYLFTRDSYIQKKFNLYYNLKFSCWENAQVN